MVFATTMIQLLVFSITFARFSATCVRGLRFTATVLTAATPPCVGALRTLAGLWVGAELVAALGALDGLASSTIFRSFISRALKLK